MAGCADGAPSTTGTSAVPGIGTTSVAAPRESVRIVLTFDEEIVPATLVDTTPARQLAAMLSLDLELRDPMGQAKSGPPTPDRHDRRRRGHRSSRG